MLQRKCPNAQRMVCSVVWCGVVCVVVRVFVKVQMYCECKFLNAYDSLVFERVRGWVRAQVKLVQVFQ